MNRGRYKKSNPRKRYIKAAIIISVAVLITLFIIFLSVGLSLSEKKKSYEYDDKEFDRDETVREETRQVQTVNAYPLPLLEDGSNFSARLAEIKEDANSVCVSLNNPDGTLLYRSSIASSFTYLSVDANASSLSAYVNAIDSQDLYTTAILYIPTFKNSDDDLVADVELSIWGSIVCEAIRSGIGDVLLIAENADEEDTEKLCALADRIHITEETAVVGLCLPNSVLDAEKSVSLIDKLSGTFDYLAFDATKAEGEGTLIENTAQAIADMQLQLMYYKMRVLLPRCASTEELDALTDAVTRHSITSWQALTVNN